jgi:hypothetical protein
MAIYSLSFENGYDGQEPRKKRCNDIKNPQKLKIFMEWTVMEFP